MKTNYVIHTSGFNNKKKVIIPVHLDIYIFSNNQLVYEIF